MAAGSGDKRDRSVGAAGDGGDVGDVEVPGEENPGVLADFGNERVHHFAALGLGVDGGEVGAGEHFADGAGGVAGIDEVVDDQDIAALLGEVEDRLADFLENLDAGLVLVVVALGGYGFDGADVQLAGDDGGWNETAAGDGDDGVKGAEASEAPGESAAIAVKLVPGDGKRLLVGIAQRIDLRRGAMRRILCEAPSLSKDGPDANHSPSGGCIPAFAWAAATMARTFSPASASRASSEERRTSSVMTRSLPIWG